MYIEYIQKDIQSFTNAVEAKRQLSLTPADIRLDLHGVLDILPTNVPLVKNRNDHKIACISFVGPNTRQKAAQEIRERIATGQIDVGVLVFNRGKGKEKCTYTEEGSKAWVNCHIPCPPSHTSCIFIDDSTDHLRSTKHLNPHITCRLFNTGIPKQLLGILTDWEKDEEEYVGNATSPQDDNASLV
jgi:hypothetical protein